MITPDDFDAAAPPQIMTAPADTVQNAQTLLKRLKVLAAVLSLATLICGIGWISSGTSSGQQFETTRAQLDTTASTVQSLETEARSTRSAREKIADRWPVVVAGIVLTNQQNDKDLSDGISNTFRQSEVRRIHFRLFGPNQNWGIKDFKGRIIYKFIEPDGTVQQAQGGPESYTWFLDLDWAATEQTWEESSSFGDDKSATFAPGIWNIQFLYRNKIIAEKQFTVIAD